MNEITRFLDMIFQVHIEGRCCSGIITFDVCPFVKNTGNCHTQFMVSILLL